MAHVERQPFGIVASAEPMTKNQSPAGLPRDAILVFSLLPYSPSVVLSGLVQILAMSDGLVSNASISAPVRREEKPYQDCMSCRIIGTAALGGVGLAALNKSRAHQPGSVMGKRLMAGMGVLFLIGSYSRWTM